MAQAKHYLGYDMTGYKTTIDAQALHEVYLAPFADAVDAGVSSLMCSYNWINGKFGCGNKTLLDDVLRGELGFEGFVTSDWGATHSPLDILAGLDMEMPGLMPPGSPWLTITRSYFDDSPKPVEPLTMSLAVLGAVFDRSMPEENQPQPAASGPSRSGVMHGQFPDDPAPENMRSALQKGVVDVKAIDRAAYREYPNLCAGRAPQPGAAWQCGRTLHWWRWPRAWLFASRGVNRAAFRCQPV